MIKLPSMDSVKVALQTEFSRESSETNKRAYVDFAFFGSALSVAGWEADMAGLARPPVPLILRFDIDCALRDFDLTSSHS